MKLKYILFLTLILGAFSCTKYEVVYNAEANSNFEQVLILKLDNKKCSYDSPTKTLRYSISKDKLINFKPLVKFQDYSQVIFEGVSLKNNSLNELGSLEVNKKYRLIISVNGQRKLLFLEFTEIAIVQIVTLDDIANESKILGKLSIQYSNSIYTNIETFIGIENRGKSSLNYPKKSYSVKPLSSHNLNNQSNISFFNFPNNNKWSLDALYKDESLLRNKLSYEIWAKLNQESIKSNFVEVFLNSESLGLYRLSENFTSSKLNLTNESSMYAGIENSKISKFNLLPSREPKSIFWEDWEQLYPDPSTKIYWDDFKSLANLIVNSSDFEFIARIENEIEINQLIDYYLFIELCYAYDNAGKNWRFLKLNQQSKFNILLWDVEATWGRNHLGNERGHHLTIYNNLFDRLINLNPNNFVSKVKTRWLSLRDNEFSLLKINEILDSNVNQLSKYRIIDIDNQVWNKSTNLLAEKDYITVWIRNRVVFLDSHINNL